LNSDIGTIIPKTFQERALMTIATAHRVRASLFLAAAALALFASPARAQENGVSAIASSRETRETNALELSVGLGSAQGFGSLSSGGPNLGDLGVGVDLGVGWRINPRWMVGAYSSTGAYPRSPSSGESTFGTSAGLQANYHFASSSRPWVGLGAGWHGYWLSQGGGKNSYQGLDLARLQVGFDVAVTPSFSLEPVIGVTLSTFLSQRPAASSSFADVGSKSVSVFFLAGALARFDLFGHAPASIDALARN
jgi:hypothetical protein